MPLPSLFSPQDTADRTRGTTRDATENGAVARVRERLTSLTPPGWFTRANGSLRDAIFSGLGAAFAGERARILDAQAQTRISTASGLWLDLIALDYFGLRFRRKPAERDDSYRARILRELLRPRSTRDAIRQAVTDLVGLGPDIFEPWNPGDCGAYGIGNSAYAGGSGLARLIYGYGTSFGGYGVGQVAYVRPAPGGIEAGAGCYGSLDYPNQIFVRVHRNSALYADHIGIGGYGINGTLAYGGDPGGSPVVGGWGTALGGYGMGGFAYLVPRPPYGVFYGVGYYSSPSLDTRISDEEIYAVIAETTAAGVIAWTEIQGP